LNIDPAEMFKVLGVDTRVRIIELLKSRGPRGAKHIAETLGITPAAASQHLRVLRHAGLVKNERKGYWIPYSIDEKALENCRCMLDDVCRCGCRATGAFGKRPSEKARLSSLMKYERELKKELERVQKRISRIKARKK
jgi:DNA-binding transcriptional ArsR family regulator